MILEIIFESFGDLFKGFDAFLKTKDLTIGAILAWIAPFILIWIKISKEKEKRSRSILVERRQLQIAFNVNEIMEKLGVESKWSIQEIGSTHTVQRNSKPWLTIFTKVIQKMKSLYPRRKKKMKSKLLSRKLWMAIFGALLPVINQEFNLGLNTDTIIASAGAIVAYIIGQAHVDAKTAQNGGASNVNTKPTGDTGSAV
jgi:hypothetical protein